MEKKKIVFLYTELATYFLACVEELLRAPGIEVHIVRWQVNKEAPFAFAFPAGLKIYNRADLSVPQLHELLQKIGPSAIYCSGWIDKGYMEACKPYKGKIPVIVGFDNQWKGTARQQLARLISPFRILNHFSHCWVPGQLQVSYALKLGFKPGKILTGFYSCDYNFFQQQYLADKDSKQADFPKRFIYAGRYVQHKGITDLWDAFTELQDEFPNDWELWCLGTGDVAPRVHPKIRHFGFVQPAEMNAYLRDTGVFVLPSHFEPWGVVVHEFAAAGFPIVCTDEVGAATAFVENNINGYIYKSGDKQALKQALLKIVNADLSSLIRMGESSVKKAGRITPKIWAQKLISVL
jgi:glycosyltransferase involved in cell wall biosynthesis